MKKKFLRFLSITLSLLMLISTMPINYAMAASSGSCGDNLTWTLDDSGTLTISGMGDMPDWGGFDNPPWYYIKDLIIGAVIENGVTSIGACAFSYCSGLTSITISDSVTSIGDQAFGFCYGLKSITIPDSVMTIGQTVFSDCTSLTSVTIGDKITYIGEGMFTGCTSLATITIPDTIKSISDAAFWGCSSLTSIIIPDSVTTIGQAAFTDCTSLTSVTLNDNITRIDDLTFFECTSLTSITLGGDVTSIGDGAFANCGNLSDVYFGGTETDWNSVEIGSSNEALSAAAIHFTDAEPEPEPVTKVSLNPADYNSPTIIIHVSGGPYSVGDTFDVTVYAVNMENLIGGSLPLSYDPDILEFVDSSGSKSANITNAIPSADCPPLHPGILIHSLLMFDYLGTNALTDIYTVTFKIKSPGKVCFDLSDDELLEYYSYAVVSDEFIAGEKADSGYDNDSKTVLSSGKCGNNLTWSFDDSGTLTISGTGSMYNYREFDSPWYSINEIITSIVIEDGVTGIGDHAFEVCINLTSLTIPDSVKSIGTCAFGGCSGLSSLTLPDSITTIGDLAFAICHSLTSITIPDSVTSIGWGAFSDCSGLTSITVASGNAKYDSRNNRNAIIETSANTLLAGCKKTTIPNGVKHIGNFAFYGCTGLTNITIPDGVSSIDMYAFEACSSLTRITLPNSITSIGEKAFWTCNALSEIYYGGSETEWMDVEIGIYNTALTTATIHFAEKPKDEPPTKIPPTEAPTTEAPPTTAPTTEPAPQSSIGDVNHDGKVKANDARLTLRYAAGLEAEENLDLALADVNNDGNVKANDARMILRAAAGLEALS